MALSIKEAVIFSPYALNGTRPSRVNSANYKACLMDGSVMIAQGKPWYLPAYYALATAVCQETNSAVL